MSRYQLHGVCIACGDLHATEVTVTLSDGPGKKESIAFAYREKGPPDEIATVRAIRVHCPKTGRHYAQKDTRKIFLVPVH
jgi:hypothetical protein